MRRVEPLAVTNETGVFLRMSAGSGAIGRVEMSAVLKYFLPFLLMLGVGLLVLIFFPKVTTVLPGVLLPNIQR